jgi:hypothetical protein
MKRVSKSIHPSLILLFGALFLLPSPIHANDVVSIAPGLSTQELQAKLSEINSRAHSNTPVEVRFETDPPRTFRIKNFLGQGMNTNVYRAVSSSGGPDIALRLPLRARIVGIANNPFDAYANGAALFRDVEKTHGTRLPVTRVLDNVPRLFTTAELLPGKLTHAGTFFAQSNGTVPRTPEFERMKSDLFRFVEETKVLSHVKDATPSNVVWVDRGGGKSEWVLLDWEAEVQTHAQKPGKTLIESMLGDNHHRVQNMTPETKALIDDLIDKTHASRKGLPPIHPATALKPSAPSTTGKNSAVCSSSRGTPSLSNAGQLSGTVKKIVSGGNNAFGFAGFFLQILMPGQNPYADPIGVECDANRKKVGRVKCDWQSKFNALNNIVDCIEVLSITPTGKTSGGRPVCEARVRAYSMRVDTKAGKQALKDSALLSNEGEAAVKGVSLKARMESFKNRFMASEIDATDSSVPERSLNDNAA